MKPCPVCQKALNPQVEGNVTKYICDCAGFPRVVIEEIPTVEKANSEKEEVKSKK